MGVGTMERMEGAGAAVVCSVQLRPCGVPSFSPQNNLAAGCGCLFSQTEKNCCGETALGLTPAFVQH